MIFQKFLYLPFVFFVLFFSIVSMISVFYNHPIMGLRKYYNCRRSFRLPLAEKELASKGPVNIYGAKTFFAGRNGCQDIFVRRKWRVMTFSGRRGRIHYWETYRKNRKNS